MTTATRSGVAGRSDCRRIRAGIRGERLDGIGAPKDTPAEIVDKLNEEINAGLADPNIKARLADLGGNGIRRLAGRLRRFIAGETEKWAKVVKFAGIKPN